MTISHLDVLIVGAGLSGIGAAAHLELELPELSYRILERRAAIGGTWDLFRYPGVRSDSDMHTLGYRFQPWDSDRIIADGDSIRAYVQGVARERGIEAKISFGHRATRYSWDSTTSRWTVTVSHADGVEQLTCDFLWNCSGYYDYDDPYQPTWPGQDDFAGAFIHPQRWPEGLDYTNKRVVIIGSGATAITLVPAMAETAAHVTMLQRSPTYVVSVPGTDPVDGLSKRLMPDAAAAHLARWRNVLLQASLYQLCRRAPAKARDQIIGAVKRRLPEGFDVAKHFTPTYDPWDQRLCVVPDGDLFKAISSGRASVETGHIDSFTPTGLRLRDGTELEADIIVSATGLRLLALGGAEMEIDGEPVKLADKFAYKGAMLDGVPNFVFVVGYANASWTLKADLVSEFTIRLLRRMKTDGARTVVPELDEKLTPLPMMGLSSGYVARSVDSFPKQGDRGPWKMPHNYLRDIVVLRHRRLDDGALKLR